MGLSANFIKVRLQIANCCASKMGAAHVDKMKKGIPCDKEKDTLQTMLDMIDSLTEYATVITQPSYSFTITVAGIGDTTTITIGQYGIATTSTTNNSTTAAHEVAANINSNYPAFPYQAVAVANVVTITGVRGASENGIAVDVSGTGLMRYSLPIPKTFLGGVDWKDLSATPCLTDDQITTILIRLCDLCSCTGCNEVVNFANSANNKIIS